MKYYKVIMLFMGVIVVSGITGIYGQDRFHHGKSTKKLNYDSLLAAATPIKNSPAGQIIVDECLQKYGGPEKLNKLHDYKLSYEASSRFNENKYPLVKMFQRGRHYMIDRLGERRIINGSLCWFQNSDTLLALDNGRYNAELYSYLTLAMPLAVQTEPFNEIRYGRRINDPLDYLYLVKEDSLMIILGIDQKDYYIRTAEGVIKQNGKKFVFINEFSDFQQHEGFIFPGEVRTISLGVEVLKAKLIEVKVNNGYDENTFKPRKISMKNKMI